MYAMYFSDGVFFSDRRSFPTKHDLDILRLLRWFFTLLETANHHVSPPFGRNIFWFFFQAPNTQIWDGSFLDTSFFLSWFPRTGSSWTAGGLTGPRRFLDFPLTGPAVAVFAIFGGRYGRSFFGPGSKKQCKALNIYCIMCFRRKGLSWIIFIFTIRFWGNISRFENWEQQFFFEARVLPWNRIMLVPTWRCYNFWKP